MATKTINRGVLLTISLIVLIVINLFAFLLYTSLANSWLREWYSSINPWTMMLIGMLALTNIILLIFVFSWKKWAYFGLWIIAVINFLINISFGFGIGLALVGFITPTLLSILLRFKWNSLR